MMSFVISGIYFINYYNFYRILTMFEAYVSYKEKSYILVLICGCMLGACESFYVCVSNIICTDELNGDPYIFALFRVCACLGVSLIFGIRLIYHNIDIVAFLAGICSYQLITLFSHLKYYSFKRKFES